VKAPATARRERLVLGALVVALLLPFLGKPLHVDDPFYVWVAQQIQSAPLDFFGLTVNWYGYEQPLARLNQNPPLVSYYAALWALVFGFGEVSLHAGFVLPALGLAFGVHALAQRFTQRPGLAALLCFATPVVLVSATSVMSDVLMLALYCWAVFFWVRGMETERPADLWIAGLCAGLCALTKYFGVTLLPLLLAHGLTCRRRPGAWLLPLLLPVAMLAAYELYTTSLYGQGLLMEASQYALRRGQLEGQRSLVSWIRGTVYAGGCVATQLFFVPFAIPRERLLAWVPLALLAGLGLFALGSLGDTPLRTPEGVHWALLAHAWVFALMAFVLVGLLLDELTRRRDPTALLLCLWVAGTVVFAAGLNWTTSGRAVLPLAPPLALLLVRRIERSRAALLAPGRTPIATALALAAGVSLSVAHGDHEFAASAREAAEILHARRTDERIWFEGHWGFQYYMQRAGSTPIDYRASQLETGDWIVLPQTNSNVRWPPAGTFEPVDRIELPLQTLASTLSGPGAGFYSSIYGPLPYTLGRPEPEQYLVARVTRRFRFEHAQGSWPRVAAERADAGDWQGVLSAHQESGQVSELVVPAVRAWWALGRHARGLALIEEAALAGAGSANLQRQLAGLARELEQEALSVRLFRRALALEPEQTATLNNLAWALATARDASVRNVEEAIALAERANRSFGSRDPNHMDTLAIAYAAADQLEAAAETEAQAALLAAVGGDEAQSLALLARAERLRAGDRLDAATGAVR
jgi:4-amino-4-deoxy-L-arabinose transferase-like glycosyltransferase